MKKLLITGAAAGLLILSVAGASAKVECRRDCPKPTPAPVSMTMVTNNGGIDNTSVNVANTGLNFVSAPLPKVDPKDHRKGGKDPQVSSVSVTTGAALASQSTANGINTTVAGCGCDTKGFSTTAVLNNGSIDNLSVNVANTGVNMVSGGSLTTGSATAGQDVLNVINTGVGSF